MTRSVVQLGGQALKLDADGDTTIQVSSDDVLVVDTAGSERLRVDASGNILIGHTSLDSPVADGGSGMTLKASGEIQAGLAGTVLKLNRETSDGTIVDFRKDGTTVGSIQVQNTDNLSIQGNSSHCGLEFGGNAIFPHKNGSNVDNQDIASATAKELNVAKKLSTLFKTFRWKDKVAQKGDKARTHTGIIAQEVESAFSAEGLDASKYGLFISTTWTNEDGKEQTRLGVRYPELFSFIFSSIEARLTALESK